MATSPSHVVLAGSKRSKDAEASRIGTVDPAERIDLTVALKGPPLPDANIVPEQSMKAEEFANKYGASKEDADKVVACLKRYGFEIEKVSLATRSIRIVGSAKSIENAFKADMFMAQSPKQTGDFRSRKGTLKIPAELKGLVTGVFGIDERRMARRKSGHTKAHARVQDPAQILNPQSPHDLARRYNFPEGDGRNQQIAVAEFGGGYFSDDMAAYCNKYSIPVPAINPISVGAPAYTLQQILALPLKERKEELGAASEVMLDLEIIAGLCPGAAINVYFATFDEQGWVDLLDAVIETRPVVLSCSWGLAEDDPSWSSGAVASINDRLNAARLLGITICSSSGDDGSGDGIMDGRAHVDFPSASPFVLSVGGTMLTESQGGVSEVTWWQAPGWRTQGGGATGGGVSAMFPRPTWQAVKVPSLNRGSIDGRVMPDVAALAGQPLYDLFFAGASHPNGGTSASAPLWAALLARVDARLPADKRQRFVTPLLYAQTQSGQPVGAGALRDIVDGDNSSNPEPGRGYAAGAGFDAVTGWGVPDGQALLAALAAV